MSKEFIDIRQLSEMLSIKPSTLYDMAGRGELPCYRFGKGKRKILRFKLSEIMPWADSHRSYPEQAAEEIVNRIMKPSRSADIDIKRMIKKVVEEETSMIKSVRRNVEGSGKE